MLAAPYGGQVTSGIATINQTGSVTNINQSTNKATINWQGFSIAPTETVNFNQPSALSMTLNRVIGNEKSIIAGALNATGKVYLINANGIVFTKGASVNVGGLVASTLNITDDDFNKGNFVFQGTGQIGQVINMGTIKATGDGTTGGYVALLGDQVKNEGVIIAERGTVALNGAQKVTLNFNGDSLVNVSLDEGSLNALVETKNAIIADGGKVILTAKAANDLVGSQVNVSGIVQAQTLADLTGGSIEVNAHGGTASVDGTLDASAPNGGDGGTIETSGETVKIADSATITTKAATGKTGTWIIDPDGFTIAGTGGDMTGTALSTQLANTNASIYSTQGSGSDGGITVNDNVSWSANTILSLDATKAITINGTLSSTGTGGIVLRAGTDINFNSALALGASSLAATAGGVINLNAPLSWTGNQTVALTSGGNLNLYGSLTGGNGILNLTSTAGNIEFDGTTSLGATTLNATATAKDIDINAALTWTGDTTATLTAGNDININAPLTASGIHSGLVMNYGGDYTIWTSAMYSGAVLNADGLPVAQTAPEGAIYGSVTLSGANASLTLNGTDYTLIHSMSQLDALDGYDATASSGTATTVSGNYALAQDLNAAGTTYKSPLVYQFNGTLLGLGHTISNLTMDSSSGAGLIGSIGGYTIRTPLVRDLGLVNVNITDSGGAVGTLAQSNSGTIEYCYATGTLKVTNLPQPVGGLVGNNNWGTISNSYTDVNVLDDQKSGAKYVGGLVGKEISGTIINSHSSGTITLYGKITADGTTVVDSSEVGGLVGNASGTITNSYSTGLVKVIDYQMYIGGFVGNNSATITNCFSTGGLNVTWNLSGTSPHGYGGFVGFNYGGTITNSYESGDIIIDNTNKDMTISNIGGFVGTNQGTISSARAYSKVTVTGLANEVAGFVGQNWYTPITNSVEFGNVYAPTANMAAAFSGSSAGGIADSSAYGTSTVRTGGSPSNPVTGSGAFAASTWGGTGTNITFDPGAAVDTSLPSSVIGTSPGQTASTIASTAVSSAYSSSTAAVANSRAPTSDPGQSSNPGQSSDSNPTDDSGQNSDSGQGSGSGSGQASGSGEASTTPSTPQQETQPSTGGSSTQTVQTAASTLSSTQIGEQASRVADGQQASASQPVSFTPTVVTVETQAPSMGNAIRNFYSSNEQSENSGQGASASYSAGIKTVTADGVTYIVDDSGSSGSGAPQSGKKDDKDKKNGQNAATAPEQ